MATYVTTVNNLSNLPNLGILNLVVNHITSIDLSGCANLTDFSILNNQLTSIDLSDSPLLTSINVGSNPNLASVTLPTLSFCAYFSAFGGSLPTSVVNSIFVNLANQGTTGGFVELAGGSNGIPDGAGLSAALYLQGDAGWSVSYNT